MAWPRYPCNAGLSDTDRRRSQEAFLTERADIIVATVAFGMGIDRSNVRFVVHADTPWDQRTSETDAAAPGGGRLSRLQLR